MTTHARVFEYDVSLDEEWTARSGAGGIAIRDEEETWTPEHLVLAGLCRCTLTSFRFHARRAGLEPRSRASAHGIVTRRESDGRFAFVEIGVEVAIALDPEPEAGELRDLLAKGERDCFVGSSLTAAPTYIWILNGKEQTCPTRT